LLIVFISSSNLYGMSAKDYTDRSKISENTVKAELSSYINGLLEGIKTSNAALSVKKQPLLFCRPKGVILDHDILKQMIDETISEVAKSKMVLLNRLVVGTIALTALRRKFPCNNN